MIFAVEYERHNHIDAQYLEKHFFAGRLSEEEMSMVVEMLKSSIKPKWILNSLKQRDDLNCNTLRIVYSANHKHRVMEYGDQS